jgi:hypothetical protein
MKNFKLLMIGFLFLGLAGLSSCKKEELIEKNLWKGEGKWNIDSFHIKETSTFFESDNSENHLQNCGTIIFKKDGTGTFTFEGITSKITYTNTDKVLTMVFKDESGQSQYDETLSFNLTWKKNKMELDSYKKETYSNYDPDTEQYVNVTYTQNMDMNLSKIK